MTKLWPWSSGAPADDDHSALEEQMSPDPQEENAAYDLKVARQATAGESGAVRQAGAAQKAPSLQQR